MSRRKISENMIKYLEDSLNCENVMTFITKAKKNNDTIIINDTPVTYEIINYQSNKSKESVQKIFEIYDIMTEANYTGFEYFPYIYGVLDCHSDTNNYYLFRENFQGNLIELINNIEHPSDWYDIVFQIIMIGYYLYDIIGVKYQFNIKELLYNKLNKPYYKEYKIGDHNITINHKYLIVIWNPNTINKNNINQININMDFLLLHLKNHDIKIPPSNRIIKLIQDIAKPDSNIPDIIQEYYGIQK